MQTERVRGQTPTPTVDNQPETLRAVISRAARSASPSVVNEAQAPFAGSLHSQTPAADTRPQSAFHHLQTGVSAVTLAVNADRAGFFARPAVPGAAQSVPTPGLFQQAVRYGGDVTLYLQLLQAARQGDGQGLQMVGAQGQQHLLNSLFYEAAVQGAEKLGFTAAEIAEVTGALRGTTVATTGGVTAGAQAGAATGAASGSATGAATTTSMASAASRVLGAAGAAYSLYSLYKNWGQSSPGEGAINGAAVGAYVGTTICPGVGTVVGGAIGACVGAIAGCFKKSGKHKDQVARDQVRAFLQDGGLLSKDWEVALKNGGRYSIGADGNDRLMNLDGTTRRAYEVDFTDPRAGEIVSLAAPIVVVLLGGRGKLTDDFTGYLTNAALSNALSVNEAKENIRAIFQGMGLSQDGVQQALDILVTTDKIRPEEHAIFSASLNEITNNEGVTSSKQPPGDRRRGGAKPLTPPRDKSREG